MVVYADKLANAVDHFNANRMPDEQVPYGEFVKSIKNKQDKTEVLELIVDIYEMA